MFPVEVQISCHLIDGKKIFLGLVRDTTEQVEARRKLEERVSERTRELKETAKQLQAVMDNAADAITLTDSRGQILLANRAAETLLKLIAAGDGPAVQLAVHAREVLAEGEPRTVVERLEIDGSERLMLTTYSPRRDESDRVIGLVTLSRDITEREQAERALQHSYQSLQRAERLARIGSWTLDLASGSFQSSEMMAQMNGVPPGREVTLPDLQKMMSSEDFNRLGGAIQDCIETGNPYVVNVEHFHPHGGGFAAEIRGQALYDDSGAIHAITGTVQDVSEREAAYAQMSAIADSLPRGAIYRIDYLAPELGRDGAEVTSVEMTMSYISAGIEQLIGISAEAMMENPGHLIAAIHPDDLERYLSTSRAATLAQANFECDFRVRRPDDRTVWLQVRSAPRQTEEGRIWDGIILDVTNAYETAEALRRAKEDAEAAERAKSDFLATMSHEIRTPMNSVIGMTRLSLQTELSPRQRNYLEKIDTSAKALLGIINDILDFSKIEAGGLELEETEFTLESVLDTVSNATSLKAEEKGLEMVYSVSSAVPRQLRGDPLRLGQVLINLVGNAVKFTEKGEITIAVDMAPPRGEGPPLLRFAVRDTGIGLDAEQMGALFRPFAQADSRTARKFGGTGLGLSISKQLVGLMGGEIGVESRLGQGSIFTFTVALGAAGSSQIPGYRFHGKRALIVDDVATAREALSEMIALFDVSAEMAASGPEALAMLHEAAASGRPFDLVLMDWRMPGMDGLETARLIRNDRTLFTTPAVLMVTAHAREEILGHLDMLDLQGLLIKPVTESMLFNAIQHVFAQGNDGAEGASVIPEQEYPTIIRGKKVLVVDDNLFNLEVAGDFLELAGVEVTTASSGFAALEVLGRQQFDVVLMDMQMPEMDGLETTRRIRENPAWRNLPVIALTAQARMEDREATLQVGMTGHLTKPIDERLMYATIAKVLEEAGRTPAVPVIDLDYTLGRVRGDHNRMRKMLELFLRDFSECPDQLQAGIAARDAAALGRVAHRVRGTAGYFAATRLAADAEELELTAEEGWQDHLADIASRLRDSLLAVLAACDAAVKSMPEGA